MTDEQLAVIRRPPTDRQLVTAGPGTGKTHVLVGRLVELVTVHNLQPGSEIAVLTFSRAAVREIRNRVAGAQTDAAYVRAVTFDSLATRLLSEFDPAGSWISVGYEGRIEAARKLLGRDHPAARRVRDLAHVLVDEVQDLVGERAEFVFTILQLARGGFTLLGDPAQGIYNFQLTGPARAIGSAALYKRVRAEFAHALVETTLTTNHRAQTANAKVALWAGALLNAEVPDFARINNDLMNVTRGVPTLGRLDTACLRLARAKEPTAILCRTNGQALMISRKLYEAGLAHSLQRSATERIVPGWIARICGGIEIKKISRDTFLERSASILVPASAETAWQVLHRTEAGRGQTVDLGILANLLRTGNVPDALLDFVSAKLVVSTIHRAKGLEFDRVVLAMRDGDFDSEETSELADRTRVLYVALSRPKRELQHLQLEKFRGVYEHDRTGRWIRSYTRGVIRDVEVVAADVHSEDPAGTYPTDAFPAVNAVETQRYLIDHAKRGDPVVLNLLKVTGGSGPKAIYTVEHNGRAVGVTSEKFGQTLYQIFKLNQNWKVRWPARIDRLHLDALETVAGSEAVGRANGLGASGLWLRPAVTGLGTLHFDATAN